MNFTFENQGTNTYLVYTVSQGNTVDSMSLGMLTNNKIPGIAQTLFMQIDSTKYIKYNVSAKISVRQFFAGAVNKARFLGVCNGIVDAMLSAEEYMIDVSTIIMDLDYIFADVSTCETVLVCLPVDEEEKRNVSLGDFFKNIVFSTQFDQTENCDHVARVINYLNSNPIFSLTDFKRLLQDIEQGEETKSQRVTPRINQPAQVIEQPKILPQAQVTPQLHEVKPAVQTTPQPNVQSQKEEPAVSQKFATPVVPTRGPETNKGFAVPGQKTALAQARSTTSTNTTSANEPKMSMFYLLQHYNKENAAIYKAQKEAKKTQPSAKAPASVPPKTGFTVPGAPTMTQPAMNQGFAIPGQPTPASAVKPITTSNPVEQKPAASISKPATQATQPVTQIPPQVVPTGQPSNFGETTVLGAGMMGETTVLSGVAETMQPTPHLIRTKNNERINLNKPVFRIGKERSYVDYFVSDNTAISRSHANIVNREGEYFVVDTNSTNHTYVDGIMIQSNVEMKLAHNMKIRLANEEFEFKMY